MGLLSLLGCLGLAGEDEEFKILQDFHASVSPSDTPLPKSDFCWGRVVEDGRPFSGCLRTRLRRPASGRQCERLPNCNAPEEQSEGIPLQSLDDEQDHRLHG